MLMYDDDVEYGDDDDEYKYEYNHIPDDTIIVSNNSTILKVHKYVPQDHLWISTLTLHTE